MNAELITAVAIGIGLAASAGFRVFVPMLVAAIAASELMKWITGAAVGGGSAAVVQSGSALTRLTSTKLTAGLGNPVVATAENVAATGTSILALVIPFFILTLFLLLTILIFTVVRRRLRRSHNKNLSA